MDRVHPPQNALPRLGRLFGRRLGDRSGRRLGRPLGRRLSRQFGHRIFAGFLMAPALLLPQAESWGQSPSDRVMSFFEGASGFNLLGPIYTRVLDSGRRMVIPMPLVDGTDYMVVAYCNDTCTNLDLVLFDSLGVAIQSDRLPDAEPMLMFTAESTGPHYVQVNALECPAEGCNIAVGLLGSTEERGLYPGEDMMGRLAVVGAELTSLGFAEVGKEKRGSLVNDQSIRIPLTMEGGMEYRVVGVCDKDCWDLDLALLYPDGEDAALDFYEDALPILDHVPDSTTEYQLEVIMAACGAEPCAFRIATYAKAADTDLFGSTFSGELLFHETVRGELDRKDESFSGIFLDEVFHGSLLDTYSVEAKAGQRIVLDLRSEDFDTILRILDPEGGGEANDDYGLDRGHSHIEWMAPSDGTFAIHVTSFEAGVMGAYVLQIAVVR